MSDEVKRTKTEEAIIWFECQNKLSKCENDPTPLPNHIVKIMEYNSTAISAIRRKEAVIEYCRHTLSVESADERDEGLGAACKYVLEILEGEL